jgi:hypothetical protein
LEVGGKSDVPCQRASSLHSDAVLTSNALFALTAMARVHRQMSTDADQPVPSHTAQLQVSTAQVTFKAQYLKNHCFVGLPGNEEC